MRCSSPSDPHKVLVKRMIGLEGDWVQDRASTKTDRVPKGSCWVEDDNPYRVSGEVNGAVPLALITGRVLAVCWPPSRIGPVESEVPRGRVISVGRKRAEESSSWWT